MRSSQPALTPSDIPSKRGTSALPCAGRASATQPALFELESRVLLDAAVLDPGSEPPPSASDLDSSFSLASLEQLLWADETLSTEPWLEERDEPALTLDAAPAVPAAPVKRLELVVIDSSVNGWERLHEDATAFSSLDVERVVWVIDSRRDGLHQIQAALDALGRPVDALHIISHGSSEGVLLGTTWLDRATLDSRQPEIAQWGQSLSASGDILFYSCHLAADQSGREWLATVGILTDADVAASTDATGQAALGGNWNFEFTLGVIESSLAFSATAQLDWQGLLDLTPAGDEVRVHAGTTGTQTTLAFGGGSVAHDADGNFIVVWQDSRSGDFDVWARRFAADGTPLADEFRVNTFISGEQIEASVAMNDAGAFVVTWSSSSQDGSGYGVFGQRFDAAGQAVGGEFQVNTDTLGDQRQARVAIDALGNFVVAYTNDDSANGDIFFQRYDATGAAVGGNARANSHTTNVQAYSSVSMRASGEFVIVWDSMGQDGSGQGVYGQRFDADGNAVGSEFRVNQVTANDQESGQVKFADDGSFVVAWSSQEQDGSGYGTFARRFDADGTALTDDIQVNTHTADDQYYGDVSVRSDGAFLVVWASYGQDGSGLGVYAQQFDALGNRVGGEVRVNQTVNDHQYRPSVSMMDDRAVVVWSGQGVGDSSGVFLRQFDITDHTTVIVNTADDVADGDVSSLAALLYDPGADGLISLREALLAANASANGSGGPDRIHFDLPGTGSYFITLATQLPEITDAVLVDGWTQAGFTDRPLIVLNPGTSPIDSGLTLGAGSGGSTIRGLVVSGFTSEGILVASDDNLIVGNFLGTDAWGTTANGNEAGLRVQGADNVIGGVNPSLANVVSGNQTGIVIEGSGATGNSIVGNFIGTDSTGNLAVGNTLDGILLTQGAHGNLIGGLDSGSGNTIAYNQRDGIRIEGTAGSGNAILGNRIHSNAGLGINLVGGSEDEFGVTANDAGDADSGPNDLQNHPILLSATVEGTDLILAGSLDSAPNQAYRIEVFASPQPNASGFGEGDRFVGAFQVTTDGSGAATFNEIFSGAAVASGETISVTATHLPTMSTSEFSEGALATLLDNLAPTAILVSAARQGGLRLNGDGGNDAYLISESGGEILGGLTAMTVEIRFSASSLASGGTALLSYATPPHADALSVQITAGGYLSLRIDGSGPLVDGFDYGALFDGWPHTLSITWESANGSYQVYVDGVLAHSGSGWGAGKALATGGMLVFGNEQTALDGGYDPAQAFTGIFHDIRLFDAAREGSQIPSAYAARLPYDTAQLLANWTFTELSPAGVTADAAGGHELTIRHATGPGFTSSAPALALAVAENAASGTVVGTVYGVDPERETRIAQILATNPDVMYHSGTGKFYRVVAGNFDWQTARVDAESALLNSVGGRLVSIHSAAENEWVSSLAANLGQDVWLGASDQIQEGNWNWYSASGAAQPFWSGGVGGWRLPAAFVNWEYGSAPDNAGGAEHFAILDHTTGYWNDVSGAVGAAYLIEWDGDQVLDVTNPLTYSIASQTAPGAFLIDPDTGVITVGDPALIDFETHSSASLTVRVHDGEAYYDQVIVIQLMDQQIEPAVLLPSPQTVDNQAPLVFSSANGNAIVVTDHQSQTDTLLQLSLAVPTGTLTLSSLDGIVLVAGGDGTDSMVIIGTESDLNAALDGLTYHPLDGFTGSIALQVDVSMGAHLEGWYTFSDGGAGDSSIGLPDDGILFGDAVAVSDPIHGHALRLDGAGDFVQIEGVFGQPASITLAAWVQLDQASGDGAEVISLGNSVFLRLDSRNGLGVTGGYYDGSSWHELASGRALAGSGWHHVAWVYDAVQLRHSLLIDGVMVASNQVTSSIQYQGGDTYLGRHGSGLLDTYDFNGRIADVRIYSRSLSADEVAALATPVTSDSGEVAITVEYVNEEQVLSVNTGVTLDENQTGVVITNAMLLTTDLEQSPHELVYTLTSNVAHGTLRRQGIALALHETFTQQDIDDGLLTYDHNGSENFADAFSFSVDDGFGDPTLGTFDLTIQPVNDNQPVIISPSGGASATVNVWENTTFVATVVATDADLPAQTLTYSLAGGTDASWFSIDPTSGVLSFISPPDAEAWADANGDNRYEVIVAASDGDGGWGTKLLIVSIRDVNEFAVSPIADSDPAANRVGDNATSGTAVGLTASAHDADATNNAITYSLDDDAGGRFAISSQTGVVTVAGELNSNVASSHFITVRATSLDGSTSTQTFSIAVDKVNTAPVGNPDQYWVQQGTVLSASQSVLANDSDFHGDELTAVLVVPPPFGTVTLLGNGQFVYTPHLSFAGVDQFAYQPFDGEMYGDITWVSVEVQPVIVNSNNDESPDVEIVDLLAAMLIPHHHDSSNEPQSNELPVVMPALTAIEEPRRVETGPTALALLREQDEDGDTRDHHSIAPAASAGHRDYEYSLDQMLMRYVAGARRQGASDWSVTIEPLLPLPEDMHQAFARLRQDVADESLNEWRLQSPTVVTSIGIAAGYLLWTLRGAFLTATLFSTVPTWRLIDPLPVLDCEQARRPDETGSERELARVWN